MNLSTNSRRTLYPVALALAAGLALAGCKKAEEPVAAAPTAAPEATPPPMVAMAPAASVSVSSITVGKTAAADKTVAAETTFAPTDKIIVSVKTDGTAASANIAAKLTYQDGQAAGEEGATLSTTGAETTNVIFSKATPWPAGKYTVDVMVDGKPAGAAQSIEVK